MHLLKLILFFVVFSSSVFAQRTEKLCGEYTYRADNVTPEQARQVALERAKLEALAEKFGTTVTQQNATIVKNENGKSDISFFSLGGSEVKGEWIETIGEPKYEISYDQNMLVVKCSVCGKAREIIGAGVEFKAKVLNNTEAKFETDRFNNGEDIYLSFRSPVAGYIAIYLVDDNQTAFCLLPYQNDAQGKTQIKAGWDYIFFSEKYAILAEKQFVTEYMLTAEKTIEQNFLYIIFSPNEFTKANDGESKDENQFTLPRELPFADFQKWLAKNRQQDKDMKVEIKNLTIQK